MGVALSSQDLALVGGNPTGRKGRNRSGQKRRLIQLEGPTGY